MNHDATPCHWLKLAVRCRTLGAYHGSALKFDPSAAPPSPFLAPPMPPSAKSKFLSDRRYPALLAACLATWFLVCAERATAACVPVPYGFGGRGVDFVQSWPADGNAYDVLGFNHGVLRNGTTYAPGKVGLAFGFDGVDDFVELADDNDYVSGTNRFTIEFWVRFHSVDAGTLAAPGTIFLGNNEGPGNRDKWFFGHGGGQLFFHVNTSTGPPRNLAQAPFNPVTNQWYHLAVIRGFASTYKIYINGAESSSEVDTNAIPPTVAPLTLGQAGNTGFLDGQLDEISLYAYALTLPALQSIVNAGPDGKCRECATPPSGLTDWWPGNGNALDVQGTKSGTRIGGTSFGNGYVGGAFMFDGVDDAVTTQRDLPFGTFSSMTWECWVQPMRTIFGRQQIISIDDGGLTSPCSSRGTATPYSRGRNRGCRPARWSLRSGGTISWWSSHLQMSSSISMASAIPWARPRCMAELAAGSTSGATRPSASISKA